MSARNAGLDCLTNVRAFLILAYLIADFSLGRICNLKGLPEQNAKAMQLILEDVIKYEKMLDQTRKENK